MTWRKIVPALCAAALLFAGWGAAASAEKIVIKGSTTVLPIAQAAAEAFMKAHPDVSISVSGGGSGDGIKALIDKMTDIADSSRDMKKEEIQLAASRGVKPVGHRVAIDAIVPVVHPSNPVDGLSVEQLNMIYQGRITNWKEVGGLDKRIVVISRDTSSGTYETWEAKILHGARVTPRAQLQASNGAIVQAVSKNTFAIGYIGHGYLNRAVKGLKVNGIEASAESALSGKYPIARPLFMFTDGQPRGAAGWFIRFLLSAEGQKIVKNEGYIPVNQASGHREGRI
ncbi:MAG: phosphate ABC transporter substrate-binding protein [Syntrophales bacterium]